MAKAKILLVEDNPDGRELLVMVLRREGYDIIEAADSSEALRQANTQHPDLILMDLGLPVMNGDEVTARIKKDPCTAHIPIVVSTPSTQARLSLNAPWPPEPTISSTNPPISKHWSKCLVDSSVKHQLLR